MIPGFGGQDGSIVVDMGKFNHFSFDKSSQIASIGAGCLLGQVAQSLYDEGRAMPHGTCPQVGLGGHATTGGIGPASRMWGLALDHVVEATVVLADSSVVVASDKANNDLFFAIRGAGPSFGIVTEFKMRSHPAPGENVRFEYTLPGGSPAARSDFFSRWQKYVSDPALPRELHVALDVFPHKVVVAGNYIGTKAAFDSLNTTEVATEGAGYTEVVGSTWMELVNAWGDHVQKNFAGGIPRAFYAKSVDFRADQLLSPTLVEELFKYLAEAYASGTMMLISFHLAGGAVNDVSADATSYPHRKSLFWMQFAAVEKGATSVSDRTRAAVQGVADMLHKHMPEAKFGAYVGHVDPYLDNAEQAYWGHHLPRLEEIKQMVDGDDLFQHPQGVVPSGSSHCNGSNGVASLS